MSDSSPGRGSIQHPPNRFGLIYTEPDDSHRTSEDDQWNRPTPTEFYPDNSQSIVTENNSPDVSFRYSLNPYRGCEHGCAYCYARPTHEYLGLDAGLDFETKIFVKERAADLFREWLARDSYVPQTICFSGVTDCYQPAERRFRLTRSCLEVARDARQPIGIVTKNALVTRDIDILAEMARYGTVGVAVSITSLDEKLARTLEPRTSSPVARLRTLRQLSDAGVPTRVMVAPVIPGLNDSEVPQILEAAARAGAQSAGQILLRLPWTVLPVFRSWLERMEPTRRSRIESLIRQCRDGRFNDSNFSIRMRGTGPIAGQIRQTFELFARRYGVDRPAAPLQTQHFRRPVPPSGQLRLF